MWFEKSIPNEVTMTHDVNSSEREVKIIELENHREISQDNAPRSGEIYRSGYFSRSGCLTGPD